MLAECESPFPTTVIEADAPAIDKVAVEDACRVGVHLLIPLVAVAKLACERGAPRNLTISYG